LHEKGKKLVAGNNKELVLATARYCHGYGYGYYYDYEVRM
jgi:hypothetical protein